MLHWAHAFGLMALIAAVFALGGGPLWLQAVPQLLFWLNASLFVLALLTGAFGRGRDGLYSPERALGWTAAAGGVAALALAWVTHAHG